jgi:hypothetical protein
MARRAEKRNNIQVGVTDEAVSDLTILAAKVGRQIGLPRLTRATLATWAVYHLLSITCEQATEIVKAGRKMEAKFLGDNPGHGNGAHSGPVVRGKRSKATLGIPIPKRIDRRPKGRATQDQLVLEVGD